MSSVGWGSAKKPAGSSGDILRIKLSAEVPEVRVRLIGNVLPRHQYWITNKDGGKRTIECLSFNRDTQEFDSSPDPMREVPEGVFINKEGTPEFCYVTEVIDRKDGKLKIMELKATIYKKIVDICQNPDYGDVSDSVMGVDLLIKREKTGPLPQNVKYDTMPGRKATPFTEAELALESYELEKIYKRPTYAEQKKWLLENTTYFAGVDSEASPEKADDI